MAIESNKKKPLFVCELCQFITHDKKDFRRHLFTRKHLQAVNNGHKCKQYMKNSALDNQFACGNCKKVYAHYASLWKHKKLCKAGEKLVDIVDKSMVMELMKQNSELQKQLIELSSKPTIVNNVNNKQFNLNIFLNETCKNAMNLSDFVNSLVIKNEEFENMGKLGYVQGISNILIRGLKDLDETKRPMHCTDKKRETLYIKENNVWNKELSIDKMKQLILDVSFKNVRKIPAWKAEHPGCEDASSYKYMDYIQILNQVMTGIHPDKDSDIDKIIRNVAFAVTIDTKKNMSTK